MYAITTYQRYRNQTRILAVGFVLLYALASVRSLVPGMCATQTAIVAAGGSISSAECCSRPALPLSNHSSKDNQTPVKRAQCPFCQLALAACVPTPYAVNGLAVQLEALREPERPEIVFTAAVLDTNVGRDPPIQHLS